MSYLPNRQLRNNRGEHTEDLFRYLPNRQLRKDGYDKEQDYTKLPAE